MRSFGVIIALFVIMLPGGPAQADTWAVIVGINGYQHAKHLTCAVADACDFRSVLTDVALGGVQSDHVALLVDGQPDSSKAPTRQNIKNALQEMARCAKPGDRLIFFYTGHGTVVTKDSYLVPVDADTRDEGTVVSECISAREITETISRSEASEALMFIDACRSKPDGVKGASSESGTMTGDFAKAFKVQPRNGGPRTTATFYACNIGESAYEWPEKGHGVFSYFLLEGLRGKAAPPGLEGVTLSQLQDYVGKQVAEHKRQYADHAQTPWIATDCPAGPLVLSRAKGEVVQQPFRGRIAVSFPDNEECKAKIALLDALLDRGYDVVDATASGDAPKPINARIVGRQSKGKRTINAYDISIRSIDIAVSIRILDSRGQSLGSREEVGSIPIIGPESSRETEAAERAAGKLADYIAKRLERI